MQQTLVTGDRHPAGVQHMLKKPASDKAVVPHDVDAAGRQPADRKKCDEFVVVQIARLPEQGSADRPADRRGGIGRQLGRILDGQLQAGDAGQLL